MAGSGAPVADIIVNARPFGAGYDIGAYEFNNTTGVNVLNLNKENSLFSVCPNPAENQVNVDFTANQEEKIQIVMVNLLGQTVLINTCIPVKNGLNSIAINLNIPRGTYFMVLNNGIEKHTQNLIIN